MMGAEEGFEPEVPEKQPKARDSSVKQKAKIVPKRPAPVNYQLDKYPDNFPLAHPNQQQLRFQHPQRITQKF